MSKQLELRGSTHRETARAWWRVMHQRDYPTICEVCQDPIGDALYQRTRFGAYIFPVEEPGVLLEYVCKRCYDCNYGWLYEVRCKECGSVHTRNQKCDGPYTCSHHCDTCKRNTLHERTDVHMADTTKDDRP